MPPKDKKNSFLVAYGLYGAVGFQLVICVVLGLLAGQWLDGRWGTAPWITVAGVVLGVAAGFYNLVRVTTMHAPKDDEKN